MPRLTSSHMLTGIKMGMCHHHMIKDTAVDAGHLALQQQLKAYAKYLILPMELVQMDCKNFRYSTYWTVIRKNMVETTMVASEDGCIKDFHLYLSLVLLRRMLTTNIK